MMESVEAKRDEPQEPLPAGQSAAQVPRSEPAEFAIRTPLRP